MKKFKLFTTIASLCLAVALMAFGVYAATTTVNVGVSGNIAIAVDANVKAKVVLTDKLTNATDQAETSKLVGTEGKVLFESATDAAAEPTTAATTYAYGDLNFKAASTSSNIEFEYTITITNNADSKDTYKYVKVEITTNPNDSTKTMEADGYSITATNNATNGYVAVGASKTFVVKVILNANKTQNNISIASALKLTMTDTNA